MIRSDRKYVGECCRNHSDEQSSQINARVDSSDLDHNSQSTSSEMVRDPMVYDDPRPFATCKISSREGSTAYKILEDFKQGGEVEIKKQDGGRHAWATTHSIKIITSHPSSEGAVQCMSPIFHP